MDQGNKWYFIATAVLFIVLTGCVIYFSSKDKSKVGFFYNQKVFTGFDGTKALTKRVEQLRSENKKTQDSLKSLISLGRQDLVSAYDQRAEINANTEQQMSEKYTADIWQFINEGVAEYGKNNDYHFIFGALGNGSLMYADSSKDVTEDVVRFLNEKYRGTPK